MEHEWEAVSYEPERWRCNGCGRFQKFEALHYHYEPEAEGQAEDDYFLCKRCENPQQK